MERLIEQTNVKIIGTWKKVLIEWTDGKTSIWNVDKYLLRSLMKNKKVNIIMDGETCAIIYEKAM